MVIVLTPVQRGQSQFHCADGYCTQRELVHELILCARLHSDVVPKGGEKRMVKSFSLAISVRVVSRSVEIGNAEYTTQISKKVRGKLFSVIGEAFARGTIQKNPMFREGLGNVMCRCGA